MLNVGEKHTKNYVIQPGHTVPDILPEATEFSDMPDVFTTGCLLAVMEWVCIEHLASCLDSGLISLGVAMKLTHDSPCTTGTPLVLQCTVIAASKKSVTWEVEVRSLEGEMIMGRGTHTRAIVSRKKFSQSVDCQTEIIGGQRLLNP